ncbi:MAG TPA: hypothetical protein DDZ99_05905 [Clostridiales bacterium]|nr:hypothetical protein [Clostridiales bacterium]
MLFGQNCNRNSAYSKPTKTFRFIKKGMVIFMQHTIKNFLYRIICGFLFGISVIMPGVSGSVMAVIMGIYDKLINIVSSPFKNLKENIIFCIPIGIGAVIGVGLFIRALDWMFEYYKVPLFLLFIGLIAGSIPAVLREAKIGSFKKKYIIGILFAFVFAVVIGILEKNGMSLKSDISDSIYISICGAVAGITSMIPGMSVSMILMVLGVYQPLLDAAANFDVLTMAPVVVCFIFGMILFSKLTKYVFEKYHKLGYYMVSGFMSGSVVSITINYFEMPADIFSAVVSILAFLVGVYISTVFRKMGRKFNIDKG